MFHDLHFDGLDTLCTVYLNGEKILEADNMFLPYLVSFLVRRFLVMLLTRSVSGPPPIGSA